MTVATTLWTASVSGGGAVAAGEEQAHGSDPRSLGHHDVAGMLLALPVQTCLIMGDMTAAHAHELPPEHGDSLVLTPEEVAAVERDGKIVVLTRGGRPVAQVHAIDPDQAWFWTPEWQDKEHEVEEERAAGIPARQFDSGEDFVAYLEAAIEDPAKL